MNEFNHIIVTMIGTIAVINLVAIILQGTKKVDAFAKDKNNVNRLLNLGILGGIFGIYATINGFDTGDNSIISIRDVGPMMAGCLGGPISGLIAGFIAGLHRLLIGFPNIFDGTTIPCALSTLSIGLFCGVFFNFFKQNKNKGFIAFIIGMCMEIFHMLVVFIYVMYAKDLLSAIEIIQEIAPLFIISNGLGFGLMIFTTDMIDKYKEAESSNLKKETELKTAKNIQNSMLPIVDDELKNAKEFDIFASMCPAKEVGGDFYDFYFVKDDYFVFTIADVSDKSVPAALFMIMAKTIIKNNLKLGLPLKEAIEKSNEQIAEGNDENVFVSAWIGVLEISTGKLFYVNAGHTYPIIMSDNVNLLKNKSGFVLGGIEDSKYEVYELNLKKGDVLYLYTDGVTDANNGNEFYGIDRLVNLLKKERSKDVTKICNKVKEDLDKFTINSLQFDDIAMLCLKYNGPSNEIILDASLENISKLTDFVNKKIDKYNCSKKTKSEINIVIDEIFGNIVKHGYKNKQGKLCVKTEILDNPLTLVMIFEDEAFLYNPTLNKEVNVKTNIDDKKYGGLGVHITKKIIDSMEYENKDGKNILKIKKKLK